MGHWYSQDRKPQHFIVGANGKDRDSTLRDARKFGWVPSVTGILDQINKPGLNLWKQNQILLAALTLPKIPNESLDQFSERVITDAYKASGEARDIGGEIHADIERLFLGDAAVIHRETAQDAADAIKTFCGCDTFIPEQIVVGEGYGGMVDLHNDLFCIDHKTKDITEKQWTDYTSGKNPRIAYQDHCMQLAAYHHALGGTDKRCLNVFIDRVIPGRVIIHEWTTAEIERGFKMFMLQLYYWQIDKEYYPNDKISSTTNEASK